MGVEIAVLVKPNAGDKQYVEVGTYEFVTVPAPGDTVCLVHPSKAKHARLRVLYANHTPRPVNVFRHTDYSGDFPSIAVVDLYCETISD